MSLRHILANLKKTGGVLNEEELTTLRKYQNRNKKALSDSRYFATQRYDIILLLFIFVMK